MRALQSLELCYCELTHTMCSQPPEGVMGLGVLTLVIFTLGEDTIGRDGFDTHDAPRGGNGSGMRCVELGGVNMDEDEC